MKGAELIFGRYEIRARDEAGDFGIRFGRFTRRRTAEDRVIDLATQLARHHAAVCSGDHKLPEFYIRDRAAL